MTSKNIMQTGEFVDIIFYTCSCACQDNDHMQEITLRHIDGDVELSMSGIAYYPEAYRYDKWYKKLWVRIKAAVKILWGRELVINTSFQFDDEHSMKDYLNAIEEGIRKLKN